MKMSIANHYNDTAARFIEKDVTVEVAAQHVAVFSHNYGKPKATENERSQRVTFTFPRREGVRNQMTVYVVGTSLDDLRYAARKFDPRTIVSAPTIAPETRVPAGYFACVCGTVCESRGALFCDECTQDEIDFELADALKPALMLATGTYTLTYLDGTYFTFRVREVKTGKLEGKTIVEYLSGPDNSLDFTAFAMMHRDTINVWKKYEGGDLVNRAREIEAMARNDTDGLEAAGLRYAERSSRCRRCNKVLTVSASIGAGYGPDCAEFLGVPYGLDRPVSGESKRSTVRPEPMSAEAEAATWKELIRQSGEFDNLDDEALDAAIDSCGRTIARAEDVFGLPKTQPQAEAWLDRATAERNRRHEDWLANLRTEGFAMMGAALYGADTDFARQVAGDDPYPYEDRAADRYDAKHFRGETGFGLA